MQHTSFELAAGGVIGRDHRSVHKNYQDSVHVVESPECTVAVVADGCGSGPHSEVGAELGTHLLCEAVKREVSYRISADINWERVLSDVLSALHVLTLQMGGSFRQTVEDNFLFTLVGVLLAHETATFFALGDGLIVVNGEVTELGPFPGNRPPYAGYGLLGDSVQDMNDSLGIHIIDQRPLDELQHFLLGSDGLGDLIKADTKHLPGSTEPVGELAQFWNDDRYYCGNPDLVSRRLRTIARDWPKKDPEPGLLPDDTTLVVGRRAEPQP